MDTKSVWEFLAKIPIGTIVAWGAVIISIVTIITKFIVKLFEVYKMYNNVVDENMKQKLLIEEHDAILGEIKNALEDIKGSLDEQKGVNLRQLRYTIVHTCDEAISAGEISAGKLKSLIELYDEYVDVFNGNGYVKVMVEKVKELPVIGKLDN